MADYERGQPVPCWQVMDDYSLRAVTLYFHDEVTPDKYHAETMLFFLRKPRANRSVLVDCKDADYFTDETDAHEEAVKRAHEAHERMRKLAQVCEADYMRARGARARHRRKLAANARTGENA